MASYQLRRHLLYKSSDSVTKKLGSPCQLQIGRPRWLNTTNNHPFMNSFQSNGSLGVFERLVKPSVDSIAPLPEVAVALKNHPTIVTVEGLRRAAEILESMPGPLHTAVLSLLADSFYLLGLYDEAITTLQQILTSINKNRDIEYMQVEFAMAKALFLSGNFESALHTVTALLDQHEVKSSPILSGKVMNVKGAIMLVNALNAKTSLDEINESIYFLQRAANNLEQGSPEDASEAFNNLGIALAISELQGCQSNRDTKAISSFQIAQQKAKLAEGKEKFLMGCIYSNMAHLLLHGETEDSSVLKLASEYSREAMLIFEQNGNDINLNDSERQNCLSRALSLVALCYTRVDSAVMAEGLYQAAIDNNDPLDIFGKLCHRDALQNYSDLCEKWDKREADAYRLQQSSDEINASLPQKWRDKHGIFSGLVIPREIY